MSYRTKELLGQAIDELCDSLHLKSRSQLWEYADVDRHQWYRLLRLGYKQMPNTQNIAELIDNLRERDYKVSTEIEKHLYAALGVTIKTENESGIIPTPPPAPDYFGGREDVLEQLRTRLLGEQKSSTLAVCGFGGIGKTTLARQLAHDLFYRDKAVGAVLWAELTRQPDPLNLLLSWAYYANPSFSYANQPLPQLALQVKALLENLLSSQLDPTQPKRILVVLDDVWENGKETARLLRQACPENATILLTTRSQSLAVELAGSQVQILEALEPAQGIELLQIYLPNAELNYLAELTKVLGGHPLALSLAARRVLKKVNQTKALPEQLKEYRQGLAFGICFRELQRELGTSPEDNLSVVFSHSYATLSPENQEHFRALGVLAYDLPFDTGILAELWQVEETQIEKWLDELRLEGLLEIAPENGEGWYRQHALLQAYARSLVQDSPDWTTFQDRYEQYLVTLTGHFDRLKVERWQKLRPFLGHLHALGQRLVMAVTQNLAHNEESVLASDSIYLLKKALQFAKNTATYLRTWSEIHQPDWLEMGLAVAKALQDRSSEAYFLEITGYILAQRGKVRLGIEHSLTALLIFRELGEVENELISLITVATLYAKIGERQTVLEYSVQALPLAQKLGDQEQIAAIYNNTGMAYAYLDKNQLALDYFFKALAIRRELKDLYKEGSLLNNIGSTYTRMGDNQKALAYCLQSLELRQRLGDLNGQATASLNSGVALARLGQPEKALSYLQHALELDRQIGDELGRAIINSHVGRVYFQLNKIDLALEYLEQARVLFAELGHLVRKAGACYHIGKVYEKMGDWQTALHYYLESTILPENSGYNLEESIRLYDVGRLYRKLGDLEKANIWFSRGLGVVKLYNPDQIPLYQEALEELSVPIASHPL
jgi:tetratricopeptide (TPR) repeat protein